MENNQSNSPLALDSSKDRKKDLAKKLYKALHDKPISRRMAATILGFPDQTYMVTQEINDWIKLGRAQVIGQIKCLRSGRKVEAITTNPALFISKTSNQLTIFDL